MKACFQIAECSLSYAKIVNNSTSQTYMWQKLYACQSKSTLEVMLTTLFGLY